MLILFFSGVMGTQLIKTQKCQKYFLKTTKRQLKKTVHKKGAEKATKLRAEQSTHFLVVLLWLCYGWSLTMIVCFLKILSLAALVVFSMSEQ